MSSSQSSTGPTRLQKIKRAVESITTSHPKSDLDDYFWFKPSRSHPQYYGLASTDKDIEGHLYAVDVDTKASFNRAGFLEVSATVTLYNAYYQHTVYEEQIFAKEFTGNYQPPEQAFLNNFHHHENNISEELETAVKTAEMHVKDDEEMDRY